MVINTSSFSQSVRLRSPYMTIALRERRYMEDELSAKGCFEEANEHLAEARATSDAETRKQQCLAWARAFIDLAAELDNGPKVSRD